MLERVRTHRRMVSDHANRRDIKMVDDEIRIDVTAFCQPCGDWVGDRMTVEDMFPLARLDDATGAVCLGLVLRDGSTVYGPGHPAACGP